MSEELDQMKSIVKQMGESWEAHKKNQDEINSKLEKGDTAISELQAKQAKIDESLNQALDMKKELEDTAAAVRRMSGAYEEQAEKKGVDLEVYAGALKKWVKSGFDKNLEKAGLSELEVKIMSTQSNPDGGYSVLPFMGGPETISFETSPMRSLASVTTIGTNELVIPVDDQRSGSRWAGEGASVATTSTPQTGQVSIKVKKLEAYPEMTEELMEDSNFDIVGWLQEKVGDDFVLKENTAFVNGDGVLAPRGIMTYDEDQSTPSGYVRGSVGTTVAASASAITSDEVLDFLGTLKADYRPGSYVGFTRATETYMRKLKDGQGNYLFSPDFTMGAPNILAGTRIVIMEDMADIGSDALSMVLADFRRAYQIVDRVGISVLEDKFTALPNTRWYIRKRVGGGIKNFDAVKYFKQNT